MNVRAFRKQRNAALRSLDRKKILAFAKRWGTKLPSSDRAFWLGVHKARVSCEDLTHEERKISLDWLREHGSGPLPGETYVGLLQ